MSDQLNGAKNMKVIVIGGADVGKTLLINTYISGPPPGANITRPPPTVQLAFSQKDEVIGERTVHLQICDTVGDERYQSLSPSFYRGAQGALVVFDVTEEKSFRKVGEWINELNATMPETLITIIIGNKIDLDENKTITRDEAVAYADKYGIPYLETSAVTGNGVQNAFQMLAEKFLEQEIMKPTFTPNGIDLTAPTKSEKQCC
jgi:small GTP-binding protein